MKKLLIAALVAVSVATSAFAADTKSTGSVVRESFNTTFRKATEVSWTSYSTFEKATFVLDNVQREAFYNFDGRLLGTSRTASFDELSAKAKASFSKQFEGYAVREAILFSEDDEDAYYISAENQKQTVVVKVTGDNISLFKKAKR